MSEDVVCPGGEATASDAREEERPKRELLREAVARVIDEGAFLHEHVPSEIYPVDGRREHALSKVEHIIALISRDVSALARWLSE